MTIFGPDISSYQDGLVISRLSNASFVIAKTTEGTFYTDADYQTWRQQTANLGKPFVWYHFLSGEDAGAQARHTLANVGDSRLPGMLDAEPAGSFSPSLAQMVAYVDAAHAVGLNLRLVYLPRWYWQQIGSPGLSALASRGLSLVSSSYPGGSGSAPSIYPGDGAAGWQSYGGMAPLLYQFTNQASDGGQLLDYNAFRGSVDELAAALHSAPTTGGITVTPDEIQAVAAAVYRHGEESVTLNGGVVKSVPLGNLAHGAWVATNDPRGPVLSTLSTLQASINAVAAKVGAPNSDALAAVVAPLKAELDAVNAKVDALPGLINQHVADGATVDELAVAVMHHLSAATANG